MPEQMKFQTRIEQREPVITKLAFICILCWSDKSLWRLVLGRSLSIDKCYGCVFCNTYLQSASRICNPTHSKRGTAAFGAADSNLDQLTSVGAKAQRENSRGLIHTVRSCWGSPSDIKVYVVLVRVTITQRCNTYLHICLVYVHIHNLARWGGLGCPQRGGQAAFGRLPTCVETRMRDGLAGNVLMN